MSVIINCRRKVVSVFTSTQTQRQNILQLHWYLLEVDTSSRGRSPSGECAGSLLGSCRGTCCSCDVAVLEFFWGMRINEICQHTHTVITSSPQATPSTSDRGETGKYSDCRKDRHHLEWCSSSQGKEQYTWVTGKGEHTEDWYSLLESTPDRLS